MRSPLKVGDRVRLTRDLRHGVIKKGEVGTVTMINVMIDGKASIVVTFPYRNPYSSPNDPNNKGWNAAFNMSEPVPFEEFPKMLSTGQAAKFLKVFPRTVAKWCDMGRLPHTIEDGTKNRLIKPADLIKFMQDNEFPVPDALADLIKDA